MKLRNNFTEKSRLLFLDLEYTCSMCLGNGIDSGGMSLHHILGREYKSPYNASPLCGKCHKIADNKSVNGLSELEIKLLNYTKRYLDKIGYRPDKEDMSFLEEYKNIYG